MFQVHLRRAKKKLPTERNAITVR